MKQLVLLLVLASLTGCHSLHRSIKKSRKHRIAKVESTQLEHSPEETEQLGETMLVKELEIEQSETVGIDQPDSEEEKGVKNTGKVPVKSLEDAPEVVTYNEYGDPTEEELAAKKKYNKNFWFTLITSIIGAPVAVTVGIITFNPIVFLAIAVPFLLTALALALFQIYKIAPTVPDKLVDKKYQRRYIYTDIVLIVVSVLIGVGLLGLFSRLV